MFGNIKNSANYSKVVTQKEFKIIADISTSLLSRLTIADVLQNAIDQVVSKYKLLGGILFLVENDVVYAKTIADSLGARTFLKLLGRPVSTLQVRLDNEEDNYIIRSIKENIEIESPELLNFTRGVLSPKLTSAAKFLTSTHSCIGLPVRYKGNTIGALFFQNAQVLVLKMKNHC
jgi:transcriptional regulator with GAF, ATPase, and Fis domain